MLSGMLQALLTLKGSQASHYFEVQLSALTGRVPKIAKVYISTAKISENRDQNPVIFDIRMSQLEQMRQIKIKG